MARGKQGKQITVKMTVAEERMSPAELDAALDTLALLCAKKYALDHRDEFGPYLDEGLGDTGDYKQDKRG